MAKYSISAQVYDTQGTPKYFRDNYVIEASDEKEAKRLFLIQIIQEALNNLDNDPFTPQKAMVSNIQPWYDNYDVTVSANGGEESVIFTVNAKDENHARALAMERMLETHIDIDYNDVEIVSVQLTPNTP